MSACCGRHRDVLLLPPSGKDLLPCWKGVLSRNISIFAAISGSASAPVKVKVTQSCLTLQTLGILEARILEWVAFPFSRGSSQPRSPTLQADPLPAEPQGKPKNTGMGGLSLLQQIFPTHESNWGLLLCRQILYQLSYQGSSRCSKIPFL